MKNYFRKIISTLVKWLQPKYGTLYSNELPLLIDKRIIYIIGEQGNQWLITFKCPCGCNTVLNLNLLKNAKPCWNYKIDSKKSITIYPSVSRIKGCKSHFFVRKSKIDWVK